MGIQLNGTSGTDIISAVDGSLTVEGLTISGDFNVVGHSELDNVNVAGILTAVSDGNAGVVLHRTFSGNVSGATNTPQLDFTLTDTATSNQSVAKISPQALAGTGDAFKGNMRFFTANDAGTSTERARIDSSGRLLLGTTTEGNISADDLTVAGSGDAGITVRSGTSNSGNLFFSDGTSGGDEYRGYLQYQHSTDKLSIGTNATTAVLLDSFGNATITGITTAKSFVPTEGQLSHRNLVQNGAMRISQRGTSFTANGYSLDRWYRTYSSGTAALTQSALTSGDPFDAGFRYTLRHTQPGSAMSDSGGAYVNPQIHLEAQDLANSGWNYKSASSYLTLSFWAKSSVAQTFYHYMIAHDGTAQAFSFGYTLAANTWKKIEVQIPGNSNLQFDDNNGSGLTLYFNLYFGTDRTDAGNTTNAWANWNSSSRTPVQTNTWFTTANATFDYTGVQLEVGSVATPFEHRSYSDELIRCQRYFQAYPHDDTTVASGLRLNGDFSSVYQTPMRDVPTGTVYGVGGISGANNGKYDKDGVGNVTAAIETKHSGFEIDTDGGQGLAAVTLDSEL